MGEAPTKLRPNVSELGLQLYPNGSVTVQMGFTLRWRVSVQAKLLCGISFLVKSTEANDVGCKSSVSYNINVVSQHFKLKLCWS